MTLHGGPVTEACASVAQGATGDTNIASQGRARVALHNNIDYVWLLHVKKDKVPSVLTRALEMGIPLTCTGEGGGAL